MGGIAEKLVLMVALAVPVGIVLVGLQYVPGITLPEAPSGVVRLLEPPVARRTPLAASLPTPEPAATRYSPLDEAPPPTLVPSGRADSTPRPGPTLGLAREQVVVGNTGGIGAALRGEPGGPQVWALRDGVLLDVLERRSVDGRDWVRVRAPDGKEGWVIGLATLPLDGRAPIATLQVGATPEATPVASAPPRLPERPPTPAAEPAGGRTYTIEAGDDLGQIAEQFGVSAESILATNEIADPESLSAGQELTIPEP